LGIEAQKAAVAAFLRSDDAVVGEFTETESGKLNNRPQLQVALQFCRQRKATLLIARLDRLARRVSFLSALMDSDVQFVAVDNPNATRFTLHILAAVAEHEADMISKRTVAALAAAKARGVALGGWRGHIMPEVVRAKGRAVQAQAARERAQCLAPVVAEIRQAGISTLRGIAQALTERGVPTAAGGSWHPQAVSNLLNHPAG
jgi:DNA invertase Pin-like site-specific DNA recombinase